MKPKKISCLRLSQISASDLLAKQMNALRGGATCTCTCECTCSCTPNCTCTPYNAGGLSNSMTTSSAMLQLMSYSNESGMANGGSNITNQPTLKSLSSGYGYDYGD